jgi:hypothetical protein
VKLREVTTPIALIVLAAGAAAYAYAVDRRTVSDADRAARRREVFPTFRVEDVTRVELTRPDGSLVLSRNDSAGRAVTAWTLAAPAPAQADPGAVEVLLRELELATRIREVEGGVATGVDAPRVRGSVTMGPLVLRFALGADSPKPAGSAYLRVEGEGTFVVGRSLRMQLLRDADAYRVRSLVPYGMSEVERLQVWRPGKNSFALNRNGATFRLDNDGVRANRAAVERLFVALADAGAETFLGDAIADRALGEGLRVELVPRDANHPRVELLVGGPCPGNPDSVVAVRKTPSRMSVCVARGLSEALAIEDAALADTSPFFAHSDEIEEFRLESLTGEPRVEVARRGSGWHERAPQERDLDSGQSDAVNVLAAALAGARASEVRGPRATANVPTFSAKSRVTVSRTGGSTLEVVELAAPSEDGAAWARRLDDGALLHLPAVAARRLQPHVAALRTGSAWRTPIDPADVVGISSTCSPGGEGLERKASGWVLRSPLGFSVDSAAAGDLAVMLATAKPDAWVTETDDGTFGLTGSDACKVSLTVSEGPDGGTRALTMMLGSRTDEASHEAFYAKTSDDPGVFMAPSTLRVLASHPVIDRRPFVIDPAMVTKLAVVRGGELHPLDLDVESGGRALDAAASLTVHAALHTGRPEVVEGFDRPTLELVVSARVDAGGRVDTHLVFGAAATLDGVDGYFARASGLDVTFFVLRPGVEALLAAAEPAP